MIAAVDWRLGSWDELQITAGVERVRQLLADGLQVNDEAMAGLDMPVDRRDPWTAACALMVRHARADGDRVLFWQAGGEVLHAHRLAKRSSGHLVHNPLVPVMRQFHNDFPTESAEGFIEYLIGLVGQSWVIYSYDSERGIMTVEDDQFRMHDMKIDSIRRQFDRMKVASSVRV